MLCTSRGEGRNPSKISVSSVLSSVCLSSFSLVVRCLSSIFRRIPALHRACSCSYKTRSDQCSHREGGETILLPESSLGVPLHLLQQH